MNWNRVQIGGRLTRDPETNTVGSTSVTKFSIAVNKKWTSKTGEAKESVYFAECEAWGATGENFAKYHKKSAEAFVEGELQTQTWEDKNGGGQRSKTVVNVQRWEFVGGRGDAGAGPDRPAAATAGSTRRAGDMGNRRGQQADPNNTVTEDDIPF